MEIARRHHDEVKRTSFRSETVGQYDVIVAGLGTAGAVAAIAAARKGLKVLAIERLNGMGGAGTVGNVRGYYFGSRGGLFEELDKKTLSLESHGGFTPSGGVNAETKMIVMEEEAIQAGVEIQYDSTITGVLMSKQKVKGVEWVSPKGTFVAECEIVIDCTGDAEVCASAGCSFTGGREFDGQAQPFSNVYVFLEKGQVRIKYTDSGYVDPRDAKSMSKAILESATLSTHLRPTYWESDRMLRISPLLGIREGRFIVGEENVTLETYLNGEYSKEPIFYAYSNIDNHSKDVAFESEIQQKWTVACSMWGFNFTVPIPLGALIPKGIDGLLVAGRSLAVDHDMAACVRMKRDMQKAGEAAAYAAYLSLKLKLPLREIPYPELTKLLAETGCLSEKDRVLMKETLSHDEETNPIVKWLTDPDEIKEGLSGIKPGLAIWSAVRAGPLLIPRLQEWIHNDSDSDKEHLRRNSAFALALLGDHSCAPLLREMVREKDSFVPKTSRKYNQARGYAAIFLLGLLADTEAVPELCSLLAEEPASFPFMNENDEFLNDQNELYFQYVSYAVMAMAKIGDRSEDQRSRIADAYRGLNSRKELPLRVTFKGSKNIKFDLRSKVLIAADRALKRWGMSLY